MAATTNNWAMNFHFAVCFQSKWDMFRCSFTEVSGLDTKAEFKGSAIEIGNQFFLPHEIKHGNIVLKRPVTSNKKDPFNVWLNKSLKKDLFGKVIPYDMVIKLLDVDGELVAGWMCTHAFPVSWTLGGLNSEKSELATETVVVAYNRLERITQSK